MSWIQRYKLRNYIQNSVWILPVVGMVAALVAVNCLNWIERRAGWQSNLDPAAALALFGTLAGSMLTFIVFLSSSLLLVVQLVSAQLSPRIIGVVFRDRVTRSALTCLPSPSPLRWLSSCESTPRCQGSQPTWPLTFACSAWASFCS